MLPGKPSEDDLHDGIVKFFREEKGWGAIASDALPSGRDAWVHFSMIDLPGYRALREGQAVRFAFEQAKQDSFDYRATYVRLR
jgi:CspA family cold shock protein